MRSPVRRLIAAGLVVATMSTIVPLGFSTPASADFFGGRYADGRGHSFVSIESNNSDHNQLDPIFAGSMASLDTLTVMSDIPKARNDLQSWTDVYWYATDQSAFSGPTVNGDTLCETTMSSNRCDRFRVRINEDRLWRSTARITHTVCHELLHTVGFDDGDWRSSGCLPGWGTSSGFSDDTTMNSHEVNHINGHY